MTNAQDADAPCSGPLKPTYPSSLNKIEIKVRLAMDISENSVSVRRVI
jgi:hypothetical protein